MCEIALSNKQSTSQREAYSYMCMEAIVQNNKWKK